MSPNAEKGHEQCAIGQRVHRKMLSNPAHQSHDETQLHKEARIREPNRNWTLTHGSNVKQAGSVHKSQPGCKIKEKLKHSHASICTMFQIAIVPDSGNEREEKRTKVQSNLSNRGAELWSGHTAKRCSQSTGRTLAHLPHGGAQKTPC